jgi:hypothetical protein
MTVTDLNQGKEKTGIQVSRVATLEARTDGIMLKCRIAETPEWSVPVLWTNHITTGIANHSAERKT